MAHKELKYDAEARAALEAGVDAVANAVKVTLGPKGRYVVLDKKFGAPTITNDGVTIAREIEVEDVFQNQGAQLVREVATATNDVAGDGTTTATVLAQAVVRQGLKNVAAGANPIALRRGIEKAVDQVVENVRSQAQDISGKDLAALRLLLGRVGKDDAACGGLLLLHRLDDQPIAQGLEIHSRYLRLSSLSPVWHSSMESAKNKSDRRSASGLAEGRRSADAETVCALPSALCR